ncbi:MAG: mannitol dehydrogenase family protein [Actinomycetales bacterium]
MSAALLHRRSTEPVPPIRIVHLGLGAFHRAHQAWYTQHAADAAGWGIAAFTGRRPDAAVTLAAQDGLYTLIERSGGGDSFEVVHSIVEANDGADVARLAALVAAESTAIVTLTITEPAYNLTAAGGVDFTLPAVVADVEILRAAVAASAAEPRWATTAAGRLVQALAQRRRSGAGPMAVVSCDNLANNAAAARTAVRDLAAAADPALATWIDGNISFVGTSVDRITPRTTDADLELAARGGYLDNAAVVTEPFTDWILSGSFPAGRPHWESAGATFVEDIEPFENRKLWLLNGAHSLLAYAGSLRGCETVAEALGDAECRSWIGEFWDEAERHLPADGLGLPAYREALLGRFSNSRIAHFLAQIAMEGSSKLRMRAVPVLTAELAADRSGAGALRLIAAWVAFLRSARDQGRPVSDAAAGGIARALAEPDGGDVPALLSLLDPELGLNTGLVERLQAAVGAFNPAQVG